MSGPRAHTDDAIVISRGAFDSGDPLAIMCSLIDYLDRLRVALVRDSEINPAALEHNAVDFYIANVANGGHTQFEGNAGEVDLAIFHRTGTGLATIGHPESLRVWDQFMELRRSRPARMASYLDGGSTGPHPDTDLRSLDLAFLGYYGELEQANAAKLLTHPDLVVLDDADIDGFVAARRELLVPSYDERRRRRFETAHPYEQAAMRFCDEHGLVFRGVLGPSRVDEDGRTGTAWAFNASDHRQRTVVMFDDGGVEHR